MVAWKSGKMPWNVVVVLLSYYRTGISGKRQCILIPKFNLGRMYIKSMRLVLFENVFNNAYLNIGINGIYLELL